MEPSVSHACCSEPEQAAGKWMAEEGRLSEASLTTPVSPIAKPDKEEWGRGR